MWPNPQETADLLTFTEEILDGKLQFLCSEDRAIFKNTVNSWKPLTIFEKRSIFDVCLTGLWIPLALPTPPFLRILLHSPSLIYTKYKFSTIRCRKSATNMVAKSWRNPCKSFFKTARYHQLYLFHSFRKRKATEQNCWTVSFN